MSAYLVDRHHIAYLAKYAEEKRILPYIEMNVVELANELERENIKSINHRYLNTGVEDMPGDTAILEPWTESELRGYIWMNLDPLQVIKSCNCYEYQACEHDAWETSRAKKAIAQIKSRAVSNLPGIDDREWGAPEPYSKIGRRKIQYA